jgi:hypothetical protein
MNNLLQLNHFFGKPFWFILIYRLVPENCVVIHLFVDFGMQRPLESPELDTTENLWSRFSAKNL